MSSRRQTLPPKQILPQCKLGNQCWYWSCCALGALLFVSLCWQIENTPLISFLYLWNCSGWIEMTSFPDNVQLSEPSIMLTSVWTRPLMIHRDASWQLWHQWPSREAYISLCCLSGVAHCFLHSTELRVVPMAAHDSVITMIDQSAFYQ